MVCILQDVQDFVVYIGRNLENIHRSISIGVYPKDARLRMIEYSTLSDQTYWVHLLDILDLMY